MKRGVFQFCRACQREWPQNASNYACTLSNCALRAALLSDTKISDPHSSVRGCPFFRACPGCKALLTHSGIGCPNITCPHCNTWFCFRCLHVGHFGMRIIGDRGLLTRPLFLFHEHAITGCRVVDNKLSLVILGNK